MGGVIKFHFLILNFDMSPFIFESGSKKKGVINYDFMEGYFGNF